MTLRELHKKNYNDKYIGGMCHPEYQTTGFSGEHHMIMLDPGPCFGKKGNFIGPGTQIEKRIARGDRGINDLDDSARIHDTAYFNAGKQYEKDKDKDNFVANIKKADTIFRRDARNSKDAPITGKLASVAIGAKEIAETAGIIDTKRFSGKGKKYLPGERLRQMALKKTKSSNKKKQTGGVIPLAAVAIPIVAAAGAELVGKIFDKIFGKSGSGFSEARKTLNVKEKKDLIKQAIKSNPSIASQVVDMVN